jgi:hypothetical protein
MKAKSEGICLAEPLLAPAQQVSSLHLQSSQLKKATTDVLGERRQPTEPIEQVALQSRNSEVGLIVLPVDRNEFCPYLTKQPHRYRGPAKRASRATPSGDGADSGERVIVKLSAGLPDSVGDATMRGHREVGGDLGTVSSGPDELSGSALTEQKLQARDNHGLASARFTGEHRQPGKQLELGGLDHAKTGQAE